PTRSALCPFTTLFRSRRGHELHHPRRARGPVGGRGVKARFLPDKGVDKRAVDIEARFRPPRRVGVKGRVVVQAVLVLEGASHTQDRKSTRLNSSHVKI